MRVYISIFSSLKNCFERREQSLHAQSIDLNSQALNPFKFHQKEFKNFHKKCKKRQDKILSKKFQQQHTLIAIDSEGSCERMIISNDESITCLKLPKEVWMFGVLEYLSLVDVVFGIGRTCKFWRCDIANEWIMRKMKQWEKMSSESSSSFSSSTTSASSWFNYDQFTYGMLKACQSQFKMNDSEEEELKENHRLLIDLISPNVLKYCLKIYILDLVMKFNAQWAQVGIIEMAKCNTANNLSTMNVIDSSNMYTKIFTHEMECLKFYFSHFTQCVPQKTDTENSQMISLVSQIFSHKNQLIDLSTHIDNIKTLIIGDGGIGKTTFCKSLSDTNFDLSQKYIPTIGAETYNFTFTIAPISEDSNTRRSIKMTLWDTGKFFFTN